MVSDQDTNVIYFSEKLQSDYPFTYEQIFNTLNRLNQSPKLLPNTKDIWARDFMPIQITKDKFIEYRYDPNYLQGNGKGYRDLKTYPDIVCHAIDLKTEKSEIIMDGGNIVKSNNCVILTDKVVIENRLLCSKTELMKKLKDLFEIDKIVIIPRDPKDVYGHSDGMLRFIDNHTVLINEIYESDKTLQRKLSEANLDCVWLRFKVKKRDKRNWAYINFLQTKDLILLPKFRIAEDELALEQMKSYFKSYADRDRIVQVDMASIIKKKGALNCISWNILE